MNTLTTQPKSFSVFRGSWTVLFPVLFFSILVLVVGASLFKYRQSLPSMQIILLVIALVTLPLPWLRGFFYTRNLTSLLLRDDTSEESRQIVKDAIGNISVILVLGINAPLICLGVILFLLKTQYGQ